ncbi:Proteasomal ubiquitin receptor ADRM1 like [Pseudolycoriella hygida]|uniref:Proteasomal ubiquitin receptor ADRM1 homolog n=1 Tax=Pseudolycoriella hygida TaxID=35572 RepID=A0A9Q0NC04_9DIPT|nr:Proteasomal ubiquitin receptor ADRM1 like [Pseudolycoriella hygida]
MSGPIFGNNSSMGSSGGNRHLVEFRAGRMNMVGKMVTPDTRKGLVYLFQAEDQLIHFCWKDRSTGKVEDDLIIFPDDCEFKRIDQCKTGRVYLLKFKSSSKRLFFWMQEPKNDKDDEYCRRMNDIMNNPPSANSLSSSRVGESNDLQNMLNNMSQMQLMQLFGGVGQMGGLSNLLGSIHRPSDSSRTSARTSTTSTTPASATATATTAPETPNNAVSVVTPTAPKKNDSGKKDDVSKVLLSELQSFLSGLKTSDGSGPSSTNGRNIDLSTAVNAETVSFLTDAERTENLLAHLPNIESNDNTKQQLRETISSPQFQQALSMFSSALQSGQLGPVVSQFQLNDEAVAAATTGDLEQFVKALEKNAKEIVAKASEKDKEQDKKEDKSGST